MRYEEEELYCPATGKLARYHSKKDGKNTVRVIVECKDPVMGECSSHFLHTQYALSGTVPVETICQGNAYIHTYIHAHTHIHNYLVIYVLIFKCDLSKKGQNWFVEGAIPATKTQAG